MHAATMYCYGEHNVAKSSENNNNSYVSLTFALTTAQKTLSKCPRCKRTSTQPVKHISVTRSLILETSKSVKSEHNLDTTQHTAIQNVRMPAAKTPNILHSRLLKMQTFVLLFFPASDKH